MHEAIIKGQKDNSLTVNYNQWIFDNISPYIGNQVLDIGSGLGNFLSYMLDKELLIATDVLDFFIENLRKSYQRYNNIQIIKCDVQDDKIVQITKVHSIDTVICNNVLEHVQDDRLALNNMREILKNTQGNLVLVLPAFQFLYSKWDYSVGHYRRYDFKDIQEKLKQANFSIRVSFYMNMVGFWGWFLNGRVFKNTPNSGFLVEAQAIFFDRFIVKPLRKIENILHPCFGQSLIIIAKPNNR